MPQEYCHPVFIFNSNVPSCLPHSEDNREFSMMKICRNKTDISCRTNCFGCSALLPKSSLSLFCTNVLLSGKHSFFSFSCKRQICHSHSHPAQCPVHVRPLPNGLWEFCSKYKPLLRENIKKLIREKCVIGTTPPPRFVLFYKKKW